LNPLRVVQETLEKLPTALTVFLTVSKPEGIQNRVKTLCTMVVVGPRHPSQSEDFHLLPFLRNEP
jgi:hypothetical protein